MNGRKCNTRKKNVIINNRKQNKADYSAQIEPEEKQNYSLSLIRNYCAFLRKTIQSSLKERGHLPPHCEANRIELF